jgi:hypothetical protein
MFHGLLQENLKKKLCIFPNTHYKKYQSPKFLKTYKCLAIMFVWSKFRILELKEGRSCLFKTNRMGNAYERYIFHAFLWLKYREYL